jgi:hypothetical protein
MSTTPEFRERTREMHPQDTARDGTGLPFEAGEHGSDYPDSMP